MEQIHLMLIYATMGKHGSKEYYNGKSIFCKSFLREDTIEKSQEQAILSCNVY